MTSVSSDDITDAAYYGDSTRLKLLVERGGNINQFDKYGFLPLHKAVIGGHINVIQLLINNRVNINDRDNYGDTALHYATYCGHENVCQLLLQNGANIFAIGADGHTPLMIAYKENQTILYFIC